MGASVAVAVVARQKRIARVFREAGATSALTAVSTAAIGVHEGLAFRILRRHDIVCEAASGMFYLDEARWQEHRRRRQQRALILIPTILVIVLLMAFLARRR